MDAQCNNEALKIMASITTCLYEIVLVKLLRLPQYCHLHPISHLFYLYVNPIIVEYK